MSKGANAWLLIGHADLPQTATVETGGSKTDELFHGNGLITKYKRHVFFSFVKRLTDIVGGSMPSKTSR